MSIKIGLGHRQLPTSQSSNCLVYKITILLVPTSWAFCEDYMK